MQSPSPRAVQTAHLTDRTFREGYRVAVLGALSSIRNAHTLRASRSYERETTIDSGWGGRGYTRMRIRTRLGFYIFLKVDYSNNYLNILIL